MGTWPIYKKHFLQLILKKAQKNQQLSFDKISPRDFYFFPFFSICTCQPLVNGLFFQWFCLETEGKHMKTYLTFSEAALKSAIAIP